MEIMSSWERKGLEKGLEAGMTIEQAAQFTTLDCAEIMKWIQE